MIVIIDYGMGNLRSVQKALEAVGHSAEITLRPRPGATRLEGDPAGRRRLRRRRRRAAADRPRRRVSRGRRTLASLASASASACNCSSTSARRTGSTKGSGLLPGRVVRFVSAPGLKIPHMGWNTLRILRPAPMLDGLGPDPSVYFVHSYYAVPERPEDVAAEADHPTPFAAMVWRDNLMACQFHPEKSQRVGLAMYANFAAL